MLSFLHEDIQTIRKEKFSYFFLFVQFVYFSGLVRQFGTDQFLVLNIIFSLLLCILYKKISERSLIIIVVSIIAFLFLNLIPITMFGFNNKLFVGYLGRIILGYLIVIFLKDGFYEKFEKLVTILALISLPLFIMQILYSDFFHLFNSISSAVLIDERAEQAQSSTIGHKYFFVYLLNGWAVLRNSGFMWEPAAFGAMLTWAALINLFRNHFNMNPGLYIILIAAFTTFSLGTYAYIAGLFFLLSLINKRSKFIKVLFFFSIVIILGSQLNLVNKNITMMTGKIEAEERNRERVLAGLAEDTEISRLTAFEINTNYFLKWPFGYGLSADVKSEYKYLGSSPNGLMKILVTWGIFGIILMLVSINKLVKFLKKRYFVYLPWYLNIAFIVLFIMPISGNPFYNQPLLFSILFGAWIVDIIPIKNSVNYYRHK